MLSRNEQSNNSDIFEETGNNSTSNKKPDDITEDPFILQRINADGDCLFNSCRLGLKFMFHNNKDNRIFNLSSFTFRLEVVEYISHEIQHETEIGKSYNIEVCEFVKSSIKNNSWIGWSNLDHKTINLINELKQLEDKDLEASLNSKAILIYSNYMSCPGVWGSNLELAAIQNMFNVRIILHHTNGRIGLIDGIYQHDKQENDLHLSYNGVHYNLLVKHSQLPTEYPPATNILSPAIPKNGSYTRLPTQWLTNLKKQYTYDCLPKLDSCDNDIQILDEKILDHFKNEAEFILAKNFTILTSQSEIDLLRKIASKGITQDIEEIHNILDTINLKILHSCMKNFDFANVSYIFVQGLTRFSFEIAKAIQTKIPNLTSLNLTGGFITFLYKDSFALLPNLKTLLLHYNNISYLDPSTFNGLKLEELYLHANNLISLPPDLLKGQYELRSLAINSNRISELDKDFFKDTNKLETLRLDETLYDVCAEIPELNEAFKRCNLSQNKESQIKNNCV